MIDRQFSIPILFLIFNRPDTTQQVFEKIRTVKPAKLFVAADGPRPMVFTDKEKCQQAREIIKHIDWECELQTRFNENNVGCKIAVSSAIDWFFENVEEGIILEDDCLPDKSFFSFCQELLEYYRHDTRVMHIGGTNFQNGVMRGDGSYYFSRYVHVWGWATWKRAWKYYDVTMKTYPQFKLQHCIKNIFCTAKAQKFWFKNFDSVYYNKINAWAHQWTYALFVNNGMSIIPNVNLVLNIGFGEDATHTRAPFYLVADMNIQRMAALCHPTFNVVNNEADKYFLKKHSGLWSKIKNRLVNISKKIK